MKNNFVRLEIEISRNTPDSDSYGLDMHFSQPGSDAEVRPLGNKRVPLTIQPDALLEYSGMPELYGKHLSEMFFKEPNILLAFDRARTVSRQLNIPLRFCLLFASGTEKLHQLAWETLLDPEDNLPLFLKENILFSRVIDRVDNRPVVLASPHDLQALIFIANPSSTKIDLAMIDAEKEVSKISRELDGMRVQVISSLDHTRSTFQRLLEALRSKESGRFDVLYMVCHGRVVNNKFWLLMETAEGDVDKIDGEIFIEALKNLTQQPLLVTLSTCKSAYKTQGSPNGFAAQLAEAGIPTVLAMQNDFSMNTSDIFMPIFFRELSHHGQIDHAIAVARGAVRSQYDFWVPALFTCLKSGRLWADENAEGTPSGNITIVTNSNRNVVGDNNNVNYSTSPDVLVSIINKISKWVMEKISPR